VAAQAYARQAKDTQLIEHATSIRMRAERRCGELLKQMAERDERPRGRKKESHVATLSDLGINKTQSSRWQKLANLAGDDFEAKVAHASKRAYDSIAYKFIERHDTEERLRAHLTRTEHGGRIADLHAHAAGIGRHRYGAILIDAALQVGSSNHPSSRSAARHYPVLSADAIAALPVAALAAPDCVLLSWALWPELPVALDLIKGWGFEYKSDGFIWVKQNPNGEGLWTGMGAWTRSNTEPCLLAVKGNPKRLARDIHQVIMAPVREHSRKPDEIYDRIERLVGGPYLELFARQERPGWMSWGHEVAADRLRAPVLEAAE
jgi:N6-adenosine-specific RNA methylase IME4